MAKFLVFSGIRAPSRTWFETRRSKNVLDTLEFYEGQPIPDEVVHEFQALRADSTRATIAPNGGWIATSDFELRRVETIGGDIVAAHPGQAFPLAYVSDEHIAYHIGNGNARITETAPSAPTAPTEEIEEP
jgi:hypothetical protein